MCSSVETNVSQICHVSSFVSFEYTSVLLFYFKLTIRVTASLNTTLEILQIQNYLLFIYGS